jgi:hypothetical protein
MNSDILQNSEDNQDQTLQNIKMLQNMEKDLYKQLEAAPTTSESVNVTSPSIKCANDYGGPNSQYTCKTDRPYCSGYAANQHWGNCVTEAVGLRCVADYGKTDACCGQDGSDIASSYQCRSEAPTCSGYVKSQKYGTCTSPDPSAEQEKIIQKINELSEMRIALFKNMTQMYGNMQNNVSNSRTDLVDQMTVVGVVEEELNNSKANLNKLTNAKNNKVRMVEINTYYSKRYSAHAGVMKLLILICLPLLILAILKKKKLVPGNVATGISSVIIIIGAFLFIRRVWDLSRRDNMNYDEYQWFFDPSAQAPTVYQYDMAQLGKLGGKAKAEVGAMQGEAQNVATSLGLGCVGEACCSPGMTFDKDSEKCVESVSKETFQNGQLNETSFIEPNDSVCLQPTNSVVKPFSAVAYASV